MAIAYHQANSEAASLPAENSTVVETVFTGKISAMWPGGPRSAMYKRPVAARLLITKTGLAGDDQADRRIHGGPERAILHYALENYPEWHKRFPAERAQFVAGSFGENISTFGMTEDNVCIGDKYRLGTALVQVSQPRRPCKKLNLRFDMEKLMLLAQETAMTGWLYRVLEEGHVQKGDAIILVEREPVAVSVRELWEICSPPLRMESLRKAAGLAPLAEVWKSWVLSKLRAVV